MTEFLNPKTVSKPLGAYSHSALIPANAELLMIAGQVGVDPKGKLQDGIRKQAEQAFRNIVEILKANGMQKRDLVKINTYLTDPRNIEAYRAARKKLIGDAIQPPSTLVIIDGLAAPEMLIEIEAMAAKA